MRSFEELENIMSVFAEKSNAIRDYVNDRYIDYFYNLFVDSDWENFTNSLAHDEILTLIKSKIFRARLLVAEYPKNDEVLELLLSDPDEKIRKVTRDNIDKSLNEKLKAFERNKERY